MQRRVGGHACACSTRPSSRRTTAAQAISCGGSLAGRANPNSTLGLEYLRPSALQPICFLMPPQLLLSSAVHLHPLTAHLCKRIVQAERAVTTAGSNSRMATDREGLRFRARCNGSSQWPGETGAPPASLLAARLWVGGRSLAARALERLHAAAAAAGVHLAAHLLLGAPHLLHGCSSWQAEGVSGV